MLKSTYSKLDEIPEGDRQHYTKRGDRYVLELDGEHPVQAQVATLTTEKKDDVQKASQRAATAEAEVTRLTEAAKSNPTLPSGHVAVPADEAKLLDSIKEIGEGDTAAAKVENIKTKLTEHATLATENSDLKKTQLLQKVAADEKLNFPILRDLDNRDGGLQYEKRDVTVDNKTVQTWHVKRDNKWIPLTAHKDERWADYKAVLESNGGSSTGIKMPNQTADDKAKAGNIYTDIRKEVGEKQKAQITTIPLEQRLNMNA